MDDTGNRLFNKGAWKAVLLAVVLLVIGELFLAWQYQRLEKGRLSELEQKIEEQQQTIEMQAARDTLREFLDARIAKDESKIARYVTEEAMQQRVEGAFEPFGVQDYEIAKSEELEDTIFRFQVRVSRDRLEQIEIIRVKKLLEDYYIDSVQLAG